MPQLQGPQPRGARSARPQELRCGSTQKLRSDIFNRSSYTFAWSVRRDNLISSSAAAWCCRPKPAPGPCGCARALGSRLSFSNRAKPLGGGGTVAGTMSDTRSSLAGLLVDGKQVFSSGCAAASRSTTRAAPGLTWRSHRSRPSWPGRRSSPPSPAALLDLSRRSPTVFEDTAGRSIEPAEHAPELSHDEGEVRAVDQLQEPVESPEVVGRRAQELVAITRVAQELEASLQRRVAFGDDPEKRRLPGRRFQPDDHVLYQRDQAPDRSVLWSVQRSSRRVQ